MWSTGVGRRCCSKGTGVHGLQGLTFSDVDKEPLKEVIGAEELVTEEWSADISNDEIPAEFVTVEMEVQIPCHVAADGHSAFHWWQ